MEQHSGKRNDPRATPPSSLTKHHFAHTLMSSILKHMQAQVYKKAYIPKAPIIPNPQIEFLFSPDNFMDIILFSMLISLQANERYQNCPQFKSWNLRDIRDLLNDKCVRNTASPSHLNSDMLKGFYFRVTF